MESGGGGVRSLRCDRGGVTHPFAVGDAVNVDVYTRGLKRHAGANVEALEAKRRGVDQSIRTGHLQETIRATRAAQRQGEHQNPAQCQRHHAARREVFLCKRGARN